MRLKAEDRSGYESCVHPSANHPDRPLWLVAVLLPLLLYGQNALGRADSAEWMAAEQLAQRIQTATPALSGSERKKFLAAFAELQAQHERLEVDERNLVTRLSADRGDLKKHSEISAEYEKDRAAWQDRLTAHNTQCNRTFTDPADVSRCDQSGDKLAKEKEALDARESEIAKRTDELHARQAENIALVTKLEDSYAAWTKRLKPDFNTPLRNALGRKVGTTTLRLTVKSFIKVVDLSSMSAESRPRAERAFAWLTNKNMSENPATPAPDSKDFRIWSRVVVIASCRGDTITSWKTSNLAHRSGKELGILDAESGILDELSVVPSPNGTDELNSLNLSYGVKANPNDLALPTINAVKPRTCKSIWHRVRATVVCRDGKAQMDAQINGSRFPSHRVWINEEVKSTLDQGPFSGLWDCDPSAPDMVR